jgi:two-component system, chemotaxis family, CheB/CheR fusion protein
MNAEEPAQAEQPADLTTKRAPSSELSVIGIGASAGGVVALQTFFRTMPADSGMAFVVILHLSPDYESQLAALIQHTTTMPVVQVNDSLPLASNHIYVIPRPAT